MPQFPFSQTHYFAHFIAARELETLQQHAQWAEILFRGVFIVFTNQLQMPGEEIAFTEWPKIYSTPKFLGTAKAYFVCHIGPNFQISLIDACIGCP